MLVVVVLGVAVGVLWSAFGGDDENEGPDAGAQLACVHFTNVIRDASDGVLTDAELRDKLKEVADDASVSAEPGVADAARRLLAAATPPLNVDGYAVAMGDLLDACDSAGI